MDSLPLVSVICLCYNQKAWVEEAIRSVLSQTYPKIELIVVDDGSKDGSQEVIKEVLAGKSVRFLPLPQNEGNCRAFNEGFRVSKGELIIDLAADDVLLPNRVELGVQAFSEYTNKAGVHFSDAFLCDEKGRILRTHFLRNADGQISEVIPQGDVYETLIQKYFICPPTMMIRRAVLEQLGGYDESLSYEDFDFWIRSSRDFTYLFHKAPLVKKREVPNSHSASQRKLRNSHQASTFRVCEKILPLNRTKAEDRALIRRCAYEIRQCVRTLNWGLVMSYLRLILRANSNH